MKRMDAERLEMAYTWKDVMGNLFLSLLSVVFLIFLLIGIIIEYVEDNIIDKNPPKWL